MHQQADQLPDQGFRWAHLLASNFSWCQQLPRVQDLRAIASAPPTAISIIPDRSELAWQRQRFARWLEACTAQPSTKPQRRAHAQLAELPHPDRLSQV